MQLRNWPSCCMLIFVTSATTWTGGATADDDYNIVHKDGSFEFGYETPDSYHNADGNRKNIVRGEFGSRNPATGNIDSTIYTAGPRGFRPRGKNIVRKYDLSQNGPRPIGSRDDPYYDPFEDPSYNFAFRTRTYNRQENANRVGDVTGKYSYVDDVGERHNVEYIAGKKTGFHVKTPFPDSNPRAYGPLYFNGRGKPHPRGRTSIQHGLDGSYRFVSAGPDQRRTETSDGTGHVRGSYTYLDDKGVQHSVHYIAGPETGYRVLKNVKGPHLPTVFPFGRPEIIPSDFYDRFDKESTSGDVFEPAASGHIKPVNNNNLLGGNSNGNKPTNNNDGNKPFDGVGIDVSDEDFNQFSNNLGGKPGNIGSSRPQNNNSGDGGGSSSSSSSAGPATGSGASNNKPFSRPNYDQDDDGDEGSDDDIGDLFGENSGRPISSSTSKPHNTGGSNNKPPSENNSYKPTGTSSNNNVPRPGGLGNSPSSNHPARPGNFGNNYDDDDDDANNNDSGLFGGRPPPPPPPRPAATNGPILSITNHQNGGNSKDDCHLCKGTIVTNVGDRLFTVPPGVSVRAHVQAIDLLPLHSKVPSPSEQFKAEMMQRGRSTEQLNEAASSISDLVRSTTEDAEKDKEIITTSTSSPDSVTTTTMLTTTDTEDTTIV